MKNSIPLTGKNGLFLLGTLYPDVTGGMEIFNYYFLKHWLGTLKKPIKYWTTNGLQHFEQNHIIVHKIKPVRLTYPLQLFWTLLKYNKQIDFVYTGYARQPWILPYAYALLFRLFRKPYIVTIHSGGAPIWKPAFPYRYYFRHAHTLVGVSHAICHDYSELVDGREIVFIPPLVPFQKSTKLKSQLKNEFSFPLSGKVLLFVGSLKEMKNPDIILKAFVLLGKEFLERNKLKLILVGTGEFQQDLKKFVINNKLSEFVHFAGWVSRESVPDYYRMADLYIISSDYEGTSLSLLEAMYNKLPIIGADSPGINKMLQSNSNALLYPVRDIEKLAECIKILTGDSLIAERLAGQAEQDYNQRYSYESMIEKYEKLFTL